MGRVGVSHFPGLGIGVVGIFAISVVRMGWGRNFVVSGEDLGAAGIFVGREWLYRGRGREMGIRGAVGLDRRGVWAIICMYRANHKMGKER